MIRLQGLRACILESFDLAPEFVRGVLEFESRLTGGADLSSGLGG